jgi:tRNA-Thr(GGU) m(6)t(6)A37 methyltransferase TsaA
MTFEPIAYVRNDNDKGNKKSAVSQIVVNEEYKDAVCGISEFSHIVVVFAFDKIMEKGEDLPLKRRAKGRSDMPLVGIFSLRTPFRPNPIGITTVRLLSVKENLLTVEGLDAFDNTPVLDIKPYNDLFDRVKDAKIPDWNKRLFESRTD